MKNLIKALCPRLVMDLYRIFKNRKITNVFNRKFKKRVLISYITDPFRGVSYKHSNYFEVVAAARIFDELGYIVDVVHYEQKVSRLDCYDVLYGFGDSFQEYFEKGYTSAKTIYYGAGMHVCHQNTSSLNRVRNVFKEKGVWLCSSARFVNKSWSHQTTLVDKIIALGNHECAKTYRDHYLGRVDEVLAPFYKTFDGLEVLEKRLANKRKSFLWFGGSGLVHKGLDLCLDFFSKEPDLHLHVCGQIENESDFLKLYENELYNLANIHTHGFIDISSSKFKMVLEECAFSVFPSCSEGGAPSVLTTVGNGALIPLVTRETSFSTGSEVLIKDLDVESISMAVREVLALGDDEIRLRSIENYMFVVSNNSQEAYYKQLKSVIEEGVGSEL